MTIETLKKKSKQKTEKIAPPFNSLPTKFKIRFYGPASLADKFSNMNVLFTCVI